MQNGNMNQPRLLSLSTLETLHKTANRRYEFVISKLILQNIFGTTSQVSKVNIPISEKQFYECFDNEYYTNSSETTLKKLLIDLSIVSGFDVKYNIIEKSLIFIACTKKFKIKYLLENRVLVDVVSIIELVIKLCKSELNYNYEFVTFTNYNTVIDAIQVYLQIYQFNSS